MKVEDNQRVYEGEDAFLRLPNSLGKSVHFKVLSVAEPDPHTQRRVL